MFREAPAESVVARVEVIVIQIALEERFKNRSRRANEGNVDFNGYKDPKYESFPCEFLC